jgi:hypothetical protein
MTSRGLAEWINIQYINPLLDHVLQTEWVRLFGSAKPAPDVFG